MKIKNLEERRVNSKLTMLITEDQLRRLAPKLVLINEQKGTGNKLFVKLRK